MFTGIVEELGEVVALDNFAESARLTICGPTVSADADAGDSIAVNGVCLTVVVATDGTFAVDVMRETLDRSALGSLTSGSRVNLERAMRLGERLGGHLVQGHVDGTASILERTKSDHWELLRVALPPKLGRYVLLKGSITLDGVSLTVAALDHDSFTVSLVPTTLRLTTLGEKQAGEPVNIEVDVIAKYVEKMLSAGAWSALTAGRGGFASGGTT